MLKVRQKPPGVQPVQRNVQPLLLKHQLFLLQGQQKRLNLR